MPRTVWVKPSADANGNWTQHIGEPPFSIPATNGVEYNVYTDAEDDLLVTPDVPVVLSAALQYEGQQALGSTEYTFQVDIGAADPSLEVYCFVQTDARTIDETGAPTVDGVVAEIIAGSPTMDQTAPNISVFRASLPASSGTVNVSFTQVFATTGAVRLTVIRVVGKTSQVVEVNPDVAAVIDQLFDVQDGDIIIGMLGADGGSMAVDGAFDPFTFVGTEFFDSAVRYRPGIQPITADDAAYLIRQSRTTGRLANVLIRLR